MAGQCFLHLLTPQRGEELKGQLCVCVCVCVCEGRGQVTRTPLSLCFCILKAAGVGPCLTGG